MTPADADAGHRAARSRREARSPLSLARARARCAARLASERHPTLGELEGEVICPTCHTTLDQSDSPIAARGSRPFIAARIAAGDTKSEIKDELVAQFGPAVLAAPPKHGFDLLAWVLPLVGARGWRRRSSALLAWRWTRAREPSRRRSARAERARRSTPELERRRRRGARPLRG